MKTVDFIVESMIARTPPWRKPWPGFATNAFSNHVYSGLNSLILDAVACQRLYPSRFWATYKQWGWLGCNIRKRPEKIPEGQWATPIKQPDGKTAWVLNAAQIFGPESIKWNKLEILDPNYDYVDQLIEATKVQWNWGLAEHPEYRRPPHDDICMPLVEHFENKCQLYGAQLHELVHWSEWRTGWGGSLEQGELIAEIATGILETELKIPHCEDLTNHNKYLQCWIDEIGKNSKYLTDAIAQANRAVNFILQMRKS